MNYTKLSIFGLIVFCLAACNNGSGSSSSSPVALESNVASLIVDSGFNGKAFNRAFITITVCEPGSATNCKTFDHILVDSGSTGLRINQSAMGSFSASLPAIEYNGVPLYTCMQYAGGYGFGPLL